MASIVINGDTSGGITLSAPTVAGSNTQTLVAATGTLAPLVAGTAVSASGTSVDFTGIPSWVKRITVMFNGVSTNGTSNPIIQIGSGSFTTSGYVGSAQVSTTSVLFTTGFGLSGSTAATSVFSGVATIANMGGNLWAFSFAGGYSNAAGNSIGGGSVTISGTLDRVRITTVNGTDTFDAGTINILYE